MKLKLFSVQPANRKPHFDALEDEVNAWLAERPGLVIDHSEVLTQPNAAWSHLSLAVWYSET